VTPRIAIVSSAEIGAAGTLNAGYYQGRQDGETYPAYLRRTKADELLARAARFEARAVMLREQAARLLDGGAA
jgi:hypothetical protein